MAFNTNYSFLALEIQKWLNREGDNEILSSVSTFVSLAEAAFNRDIRHYEMENIATSTLNGRYLDKPQDWLETINISIDDGGTNSVEFISRMDMADKRQASLNETGKPRFYTHVEGSFEFFPTPDDTYTVRLHYYQRIPEISGTVNQNWLLRDHPDAYLYGALVHAAPFLVEDERTTTWAQLYAASVSRINASSNKARHSGSGLRMKNRGLG
jgi:hypothetical protein